MTKYCIPEYIIMDQDSTFMSSLMNYLFKKLDIKIKTVVHHIIINHFRLNTELNLYQNILMKAFDQFRSDVAKIC